MASHKNQRTSPMDAATVHRNDDGSFTIQALTEKLREYKLIFDSIHNGVMVTDADGYVTHFNKPYGQFLGLDPAAQIGKHCTEVIENTRMHIVAKTGKPEINQRHRIRGQNMVVQRIPIWKDGKVIAVFGQVMSSLTSMCRAPRRSRVIWSRRNWTWRRPVARAT